MDFGTDASINSELKNPNFIPEDLIKSGFKSELVGRIDTIQEFKPMDVDMAQKIIETSEISIFNLYLAELKKLGVEVIMDREEVVSKIAQRAVELKTGARAIRQIVVEMFKEIYDMMIKTKVNDVHRTISTEDEYLEYSKMLAEEDSEEEVKEVKETKKTKRTKVKL